MRRQLTLAFVVLVALPVVTDASSTDGVAAPACPRHDALWELEFPTTGSVSFRAPYVALSEDASVVFVAGTRYWSEAGLGRSGVALAALEASTGQLLWQQVDDAGTSVEGLHLDGNRLVVVGRSVAEGSGAFVAAYDPAGVRLWRVAHVDHHSSFVTDVAFDATHDLVVLSGSEESEGGFDQEPFVWALDTALGVERWSTHVAPDASNQTARGVAIDALGRVHVAAEGDDGAHAVYDGDTGARAWIRTHDASARFAAGAGGVSFASLSLDQADGLIARDAATGEARWERWHEGPDSDLILDLLATPGRLHALVVAEGGKRLDVETRDATDGALVSTFTTRPAAGWYGAWGSLALLSPGRIAFLASTDALTVHTLDAASGAELQRVRLPPWGGFGMNVVELPDHDIIVGADDGGWRVARLTEVLVAPCFALRAGPRAGEVSVDWIAREGQVATGTRVYAGPAPDAIVPVHDDASPSGSLTLGGYDEAEEVWIALASLGLAGESGRSAPQRALAASTLPPPEGLAAQAGARTGEVMLAWERVEDRADPTARIVVLRDGARVADLAASARAFVDAGLAPASAHSYALALESAAGLGRASAPVAATARGLPAPPVGLAAASGVEPGEIALTWSDADAAGDPDARIVVRRDGVEVAQLPADARAFSDGGLAPRAEHAYTVATRNFAGEGSQGPSVRAVAAAPPGAPREVVAFPGPGLAGEATVEWDAPSDEGTAPLASYHVYVLQDARVVARATLGAEARSFTYGGVPAFAYAFRVVASNAVGEGPAAADACAHASPWSPALPFGCA